MAAPKTLIDAEIERSAALKHKSAHLQRKNRVLRQMLRSFRQKVRQRRASAATVAIRHHSREVGLLFLRSELRLSRTFLAIALHAADPEKRNRNLRNARLAFESLNRFYDKTLISELEAERFGKGMAELKKALKQAGDSV